MNQWASTTQARQHPLTALVVDDEPTVCEFLSQALEDMGYAVEPAHNAQSALKVVRGNHPFDIAFVDLGLPDKSGLELIAEIKRIQPTLPIVLATSYAYMAEHDVDDNDESPLVLAKPYDRQSITDLLRELGFATNAASDT